MKSIKLSKKEKEAIVKAVTEAEKGTSGEISTAVIRESSDYIFYELMFALALGLLTTITLLIFGRSWYQFCHSLSWNLTAPQFMGFSLGLVFLVMGLGFLLANTPMMDRLIVPASIRAAKVKERAILHFFTAGLTETDQRCAVLIFVSVNERRVELLADRGINEKIDSEQWNQLVEELITRIKAGEISQGIINAVEQCGELLKKHFPQKGAGTNQISDTIQVLEV